MARIYLDARNITATPAGVARYALSLVPELVRQAPQHEFIVVRHTSNRTPIEVEGAELSEAFISCPIDTMQNYLGGAYALDGVFREFGAPNIYHSLFHILPRGIRRRARGAQVVVTLHDLVWIDHPHQSQPSWRSAELIRAFARLAIPYALKTADHTICVSEPTLRRAERWLNPDRASTIYHGVSPEFFEAAPPLSERLSQFEQLQTPLIVAVGNAKAYKNLDRLVDAFARARRELGAGHLVLIGDCAELEGFIAQSGAQEFISRPGFLTDEELRALLGRARLFVFPSLVEGFGLPILEAMAMGAPTAVSDLEPMRTIAGSAALHFNPYHTGELARAIKLVLSEGSLHRRLSDAARARAAEFRWPKTAEQTLKIYEQLLI